MQRRTGSQTLLGLSLLLSALGGCMARADAAPSTSSPSSGPSAAGADAGPVLVELFTSQGCSSCPAADAFVRDLPRLGFGRDRVVPLTFHVDYWDDLGWKDPFASPRFTDRQRWYTRAGTLLGPGGQPGGITGAYTPQMIVAGAVHFSGGRRDVAIAEIQRAAAAGAQATLAADATIDGDHVLVTALLSAAKPGDQAADKTAPEAVHKDWRLLVALSMKRARTNVAHGENAGETLEEAAVVRTLSDPLPIGATPNASVSVSLAKPRDLDWNDVELTAFVQSATNLRAIAARAVPLVRK